MAERSTAKASSRDGLDEQVADLLRRTRTDRGLPLHIEDPAAIARIARVLSESRRAA